MVYRHPSLLEFSSTDLTLLLECSPQFLDRFYTFDSSLLFTWFFILFLFSVPIEINHTSSQGRPDLNLFNLFGR